MCILFHQNVGTLYYYHAATQSRRDKRNTIDEYIILYTYSIHIIYMYIDTRLLKRYKVVETILKSIIAGCSTRTVKRPLKSVQRDSTRRNRIYMCTSNGDRSQQP